MDFKETRKKYIKMIYKISNMYRGEIQGSYVSVEDLVQVGTFALYKATKGYEASKGASFTTYAYSAINKEIFSYIRDFNRSVVLPRESKQVYRKIKKEGEMPSRSEIAKLYKISEKKAELVEACEKQIPKGEEDIQKHSFEDETVLYVNEFLTKLDQQEKEIIKMKMLNKTKKEIKEEVMLNNQTYNKRIEAIQEKALHYFNERGDHYGDDSKRAVFV